ncbi:MAG: amidohydrolase family protein, partial [Planctomycetes bacterium]|nr:amidohydrolase family protein [Planctomycetota bacterium]
LEIDLDAVRIDKGSVEFKVVRRRTRGKDGRPLPPKVEEGLEPLRSVLEGNIPIVVRVQTPAQIASVLEIQEAFEIYVVLLDAEGARAHVADLAALEIGVIVPRRVIRSVNNTRYHQSDDLARRDVPIAFQSSAEDGARTLRQWGLYAVERGLSADAALSALTVGAARMFNLDDRIGSLNVGLDGDLVIFDGHPFEAGSRVRRVIVGGEEVR